MKIEESLVCIVNYGLFIAFSSSIITEQLVESNTKKVSDKYESSRRASEKHVCVYVNGLVKVGQQSK